jgi:bacteriocin-like protein
MIMSKQTKPTAQELKQSVLDRMDAARKAVEELSEEELESIVGGAMDPYRGGVVASTMAVGEEDSLYKPVVSPRYNSSSVAHTHGSSDDPSLNPRLRGW